MPFLVCTDSIVRLSLSFLAPLAAITAVGLALLNVHSALTYTPQELAERLEIATRPTTHISVLYAAAALGAALGSRPPDQLSHLMKVVTQRLLVIITLNADIILSVRSGSPQFLMGQVCFNTPMVSAFWLSSHPGSRKLERRRADSQSSGGLLERC